ncbi:hypothetical protein ACLBYG_22210 [Methylobacterium sp. D53M]
MCALKQRFDFVAELRAFAAEVSTLQGNDASALAARMNRRCADVMKRPDPMDRGRIDPASIFKAGGEHAIGRVEIRNPTRRIAGKLGLKAAA